MSIQARLDTLRTQVRETDVAEVRQRAAGVVLIDVRQRDEIAQGRIEGAVAAPRGELELRLPALVPDRATPIVFYCAGGTRSLLAAHAATGLGYIDVASMAGGFGRWKTQGAPFVVISAPPEGDPEVGASQIEATTIDSARLSALLDAKDCLLVDVREDWETSQGYIDGSELVPRGFLELRMGSLRAAPTVVLVSSHGVRAALAARDLGELGYGDVRVLEGGIEAWVQDGRSVRVPRRLSPQDRLRYSRHLLIEEVGEEGQLVLLGSSVLLMGAGGLGSPAAYYLAAAGVGRLGIIDSDVVDRSNLQRQIVHADDRVGMAKVESARQTLLGLNPDIDVQAYHARLTSENVEEIFAGYDLVIDGGDNFPTRYLVNDACVRLGLPCIHGSVYRFEGQVTVFHPGAGGPCYRCLYPEPPPPELAPSCAEAGVLGVVPGIIGLLQANEAIKVLLGLGDTLAGRLLHFDGLRMKFRELGLRPDPACPMCSDGATWTGYIDYEQFCASS